MDFVKEHDPREAKLPQWTRKLLSDLRYEVARARAFADQASLSTNPDETDTLLETHHAGEDNRRIGLPKGAGIIFMLGENYFDRIDVRVHGNYIDISGYEGIVIEPRASNSCRIRLEKR